GGVDSSFGDSIRAAAARPKMANPSTPALRRRLREAPADELERLFTEEAEALDPPAIRQIFRNPFLDAPRIEQLFDLPGLESSYEARRDAVAHPKSPRLLALRFVPGLFWGDL